MLTTGYHTLLEVSPIFSNDVFDSFLLQFRGLLEFFHEDFIACKVSNCPFKSLFTSRYFDNIIDQACSFKRLNFVANSIWKLAIRNIGEYKDIQTYRLFLKEIWADLRWVRIIYNQHLKTLGKTDFDCDVKACVDWFNKLIESTFIATASLSKFRQNLL